MNQLPAALMFLAFAGGSFAILRLLLNYLARANRPTLAPPLMILFGAVSGAIFFRSNLHQFFIWHVIIFALVIFSWHAKSRVEGKRVADISRQRAEKEGKEAKDVLHDYTLTRRLLSFGLVSYLAAFSSVYYYLVLKGPPG